MPDVDCKEILLLHFNRLSSVDCYLLLWGNESQHVDINQHTCILYKIIVL